MNNFEAKLGWLALCGITFHSIPDNDKRWKNVEPGTVLTDPPEAYVRESEWPEVKAALIRATKAKP